MSSGFNSRPHPKTVLEKKGDLFVKRLRILTFAVILTLLTGSFSSFGASTWDSPIDPDNPRVELVFACKDGTNFDELTLSSTSLSEADIVVGGFAYELNKTYPSVSSYSMGKFEGYAVANNAVYKLHALQLESPWQEDSPDPVDMTGGSIKNIVELVPTGEVPEKSMITTHQHKAAKDIITFRYLVNGKEVSKEDYDNSKIGSYTEKMKKSFIGYGKETVDREELSFVKLVKIKQTGPGSDTAPWSATFEYRKDQYISAEMKYLQTYEIVKESGSAPSGNPSGSSPAKDREKVSTGKTASTVIIDAPVVTASLINNALAKKNLSKDSVKTIIVGKGVKKIKNGAFREYKNAKKLVIKTKRLKKSSVKKSLKGSSIKTIKVSLGSKKINKKFSKTYKRIFTKSNAGRKVSFV